ncbi:hypothetical protein [Aquimarina sp. SS2-1]|uniref:hypothetical protein n=1 Tax=Aquimarina besae TaxID=3342247 RepID=UPI00366CC2E4
MKLQHIKLILTVFILLLPSLEVIAQDEIIAPYSESLQEPRPITPIGDEDKSETIRQFPSYCYCQYSSDYNAFINIYNSLAAREQEELLRRQEVLIKERIEEVMNRQFNSYGDARNYVFKRFSLPTTEKLYRDISNEYRQQLNRNAQEARLAKKYESRLYEIRRRELNNNINPSLLGDLAINNRFITSLSSAEINNNLNTTNNSIVNSENNYKDAYRIVHGIPLVESAEILENAFVSNMVSHFNQYNFVNKVFLMTKYMIYLNTNSPVQTAASYGPATFNPAPYIQNYENTAIFGARLRVGAPSITYPPITDAIAKLQHALNTDLKDAKSWFNLNNDNYSTLNTYLQSNNFGNGTLSTAGRIFSNYYDDQHTEFLGHFTWKSDDAPLLPSSRDKERIFSIKPNIQGFLSGLKGVGNLFNQLYFAENTRNFTLSGSLIKDIFRHNGISIPDAIDVEDIGRMFRFEPGINDYGNQTTTAYRTELRFRTDGVASTMYFGRSGRITLQQIFGSFESFKVILDITLAFKTGILNSTETAAYLRYLHRNGFSPDSIDLLQNAINVLNINSNVNPLLGADCRSFEYAKPPGALQRASAVKNFDHTFYTAGVRSNGSPYYGEIDIPVNILYFTAPNWMTNGQAANATAIAVTTAIKKTDVHFYRNPDITKESLATFFKREIEIQMALFGGGITSQEPFPIPSPAPYINYLLGIGNPFDCE